MTSLSHDSHDFVGLDDEALVSRAQSGSLDAFTEVVARFEGRLFNFIARRLGGKRWRASDAEDLTQETFLRAYRSIDDFRPSHRFSTWLFTIASRLVVDHLRHQRVRAAAAESIAHAAMQNRHERHAAEFNVVDRDGRSLWRVAQEMLTEEQHTALWLRYAEELSPREVARVLERSEVSVRVMLFRARQALTPHAHAMLGDDGAVMLTSNAAGGVV